jgi:tetratricopeptide (TPR) repeat protein
VRHARYAAAEERLEEVWHKHGEDGEFDIGCLAALWLTWLCLSAGRFREAVAWAERAVSFAPVHEGVHRAAMGMLALSLFYVQRVPDALATLAEFTDPPAEVPLDQTDALVLRGIVRRLVEEVPEAIADLSTAVARLQTGVPVRLAGACLSNLAGAEYGTGAWDEAALHAEMAVLRAADGNRALELASAHSVAAVIPAQRGDWPTAERHVRSAREAAHEVGDPLAIGAASIAQQYTAMAQGDAEGVITAAAATRASGNKEFFGIAGTYDWRLLEIEALIRLRLLAQAETALAAITTDLAVFGPAPRGSAPPGCAPSCPDHHIDDLLAARHRLGRA